MDIASIIIWLLIGFIIGKYWEPIQEAIKVMQMRKKKK